MYSAASIGECPNRSCGYMQRIQCRTIWYCCSFENEWCESHWSVSNFTKSMATFDLHTQRTKIRIIFEEEISYRNKQTKFYFYLKIDEPTQVYFEKLFNRDLFHLLLILRIAIICIFMRLSREKKIVNNRKYDIPKLAVEILYHVYNYYILIKVKSFFRC